MNSLTSRTVKVEVKCLQGGGSGSGVYLKAHPVWGSVLATAYHVVDDKDCSFKVDAYSAEVVAHNEEADIALLRTYRPWPVNPTRLAGAPYLGMKVIATGYPRQWYNSKTGFQITRGVLASFYDKRWRVTSSIWFGSSGGPVFDEEGGLVGLVVSVRVTPLGAPVEDQYYITPADKVMELYDKVY
jgi:S1-C subfamily serine protease